jgi:hypothetical protein
MPSGVCHVNALIGSSSLVSFLAALIHVSIIFASVLFFQVLASAENGRANAGLEICPTMPAHRCWRRMVAALKIGDADVQVFISKCYASHELLCGRSQVLWGATRSRLKIPLIIRKEGSYRDLAPSPAEHYKTSPARTTITGRGFLFISLGLKPLRSGSCRPGLQSDSAATRRLSGHVTANRSVTVTPPAAGRGQACPSLFTETHKRFGTR